MKRTKQKATSGNSASKGSASNRAKVNQRGPSSRTAPTASAKPKTARGTMAPPNKGPGIRLSEDGFSLNAKAIALPCALSLLIAAIGKYTRLAKLQYNDIYTWDELGLWAYVAPGKKDAHHVCISLAEKRDQPFVPERSFGGVLELAGTSYTRGQPRAALLRQVEELAGPGEEPGFESRSFRLGPVSVDAWLEGGVLRSLTVSKFVASRQTKGRKAARPPIRVPPGKGLDFHDLNFKLAVIHELMFVQKVLKPPFDVYEFVERYTVRKIDIEAEGYDPIPEVEAFFEAYPVTKSQAARIERITQDGGNDIYLQVCPLWDGEDSVFNIRSTRDLEHVPNLKQITLFGGSDEVANLVKQFKARGIDARPL